MAWFDPTEARTHEYSDIEATTLTTAPPMWFKIIKHREHCINGQYYTYVIKHMYISQTMHWKQSGTRNERLLMTLLYETQETTQRHVNTTEKQ